MARQSRRQLWTQKLKHLRLDSSSYTHLSLKKETSASKKTKPNAYTSERKIFTSKQAQTHLKKTSQECLILGIDPSLRATGVALIHQKQNNFSLIYSTTLHTESKSSLGQRLGQLYKNLENILEQYHPQTIAMEQIIYVQNRQTAQTLGAVRGAFLTLCALKGFSVSEYPPLRIKQAIVGYGQASKQQIAKILQTILKLKEPLPLDESDATATALCHVLTKKVF